MVFHFVINSTVKRATYISSIARCGAGIVTLLMLLFSTGCVTTVEGPYTSKASSSKATEQYVQLGLAYYQNRDYDLAIQKLGRALEIEPENSTALAALGLVYQAQSEPKYAEDQFKAALKYDPNYTRGRTYYGAFLFQQGRLEESLRQFSLASEDVRYEARPQIFSNLGLVNKKLGKVKPAIDAYEKSLTLRRDQPNVQLSLATLHFQNGDKNRADRYYQAYRENVRIGNARHTPQSLALGIGIARSKNDVNEEASLMLLLKNIYPESAEYQKIKDPS